MSEYQWLQGLNTLPALNVNSILEKNTRKELSSINLNNQSINDALNKKISNLETSVAVVNKTIETLKTKSKQFQELFGNQWLQSMKSLK